MSALNVHSYQGSSLGDYTAKYDWGRRYSYLDSTRRHGLVGPCVFYADALTGNCQTVRRLGRPPLALALCGHTAQAVKLAADTSKLFPNGTLWNAVQLPAIRAAIELKRDQPAKAVEWLVPAVPFERAYLGTHFRTGGHEGGCGR